MLIFPSNNPPTLPFIKLNYNHLKYQRTQIYGNLMYDNPIYKTLNYDLLNRCKIKYNIVYIFEKKFNNPNGLIPLIKTL